MQAAEAGGRALLQVGEQGQQAEVAVMRKQQYGRIINTASIGAFIAASSAGYCASKAGLVGLTKVAAVELARHGIRVNTLCPGATETPMAKHQRMEMEKAGMPTYAARLRRA